MPHVLIIGNSAAGFSAAFELANSSLGYEIGVLSLERYPAYRRDRLIEYITGNLGEKDLFLCEEAFYSSHNINFHKSSEVLRVDTKKNKVTLKDNRKLSYDFLIIASGQETLRPNVPGKSKEGVFVLQTLDDALAIRERLAITSLVCLVGGKDSCLRLAEGLSNTDKEIKIISPQKPEGFVSTEKMEWLEGVVPAEFIGETAQLQALKLSNGKAIGTSAVICMDRGRAATDFLKESGVALDNGFIRVDGALRTNIENVFACGSVAKEHDAAQEKSWEEACAEGVRAAQSIISLEKMESSIGKGASLNQAPI